MRYLLDTNIISNAVKPNPSAAFLVWMSERDDQELFVATMTLAEIWRGILQMPRGRKRDDLEAWYDGQEGPPVLFAGRILPFDERAGMIWARLMAEGRAAGTPRSGLDMIIAATAVAHDCIVATDNLRDFKGVPTINPLLPHASPPSL